MMPNYETLSPELSRRIMKDRADRTRPQVGTADEQIARRRELAGDRATIWRPAFVHDIDKIIHCPFYNRYSDKTQVFSLIRNDDITRRSLHVQLVSRIARNIGSVLGLNLDLIEAIALAMTWATPPSPTAAKSTWISCIFPTPAGISTIPSTPSGFWMGSSL